MDDYYKMYCGVFAFWMITLLLSCYVDWVVSNNGFTSIAMWFMFLLLGLICGRTLTLNEVNK